MLTQHRESRTLNTGLHGHELVICLPEAQGMGILQAQVMKGKPADARMEGVHRPSLSSIPVMFFGTLEIAWVSPGDLTAWREGIHAKLHTKPKGRKAFESSLGEVGPAEHTPAQPHSLRADLAALQAVKP